jgi:hypothetical protein
MAAKRKYPQTDVKLLYGLAAGRCAVPDCRKELILEKREHDATKQIGKIAHIIGHSAKGPRGDQNYPEEKIDTYENWILLCPNHHDEYDAQFNTYTIEYLRKLKKDHENWVRTTLRSEIGNVGFPELETVTNAILSLQMKPSADYKVLSPTEKLKKNDLTDEISYLIKLGLSKNYEVKNFIQHVSKIDISFPEKLQFGFVKEYTRLKKENIVGDDLFHALHDFSSSGSNDFKKKAAGLAVLTYLFECCEVFEK